MEQPLEEKKEVGQVGDAKNLQSEDSAVKHTSAFKNLGILDRFLTVWILLATVVGILLEKYVPETGPAL
jgi:arsenite transporter